ncbi:L,D-transpeptidase family protein [Pseudomonas sp. Hp2]|uniref:L,D-transpeptidase family protein n=1 Tax=Pseudomonas sp. Hp2 TaxID=701189 RepID=UPI001126484F|nr:L,D-transpeptidase family protein [Pseudomonas sp. Hp2]
MIRHAFLLLRLLAPLAMIACAPALAATAPTAAARQLVVVVTADWDAPRGELHAFERQGDGWRAAAPAFAVAVGRNGSAWGDGVHPPQSGGPRKREGDGRSPAGVFDLGPAFGYADRIDSAMPYQAMRATHWCMDVPDSPLYNRIVDAAQVGADAVEGSSEPMRMDLHRDGDIRYREGFVIQHNPRAVPGHGSCIFAHLWRTPGEATAGCTAMEPADMQRLLAWLDPAARPRFVLLPQAEYRRLQRAWALPALEARP